MLIDRIRVDLIFVPHTSARSEVSFGGKLVPVSGALKSEDLGHALLEIERCVNTHLPHLRMHIHTEGA